MKFQRSKKCKSQPLNPKFLRYAVDHLIKWVYRIEVDDAKIYPRWAVADGDGKEQKPMKMDWATVKGMFLF